MIGLIEGAQVLSMKAASAINQGINGIGQLLYDDTGINLSVESVLSGAADSINTGGSMADSSNKIVNAAGAGYYIVFAVGIIICLIGIAVTGIKLVLGNSQSRAEEKSGLLWKVVGIVMIVAGAGIITAVATAGKGLFG